MELKQKQEIVIQWIVVHQHQEAGVHGHHVLLTVVEELRVVLRSYIQITMEDIVILNMIQIVVTKQVVVHQHTQIGIAGDHVMQTVEQEQNIDLEQSTVTMMVAIVELITIQHHVMQDHVDHHLIHVDGIVEMLKNHIQ